MDENNCFAFPLKCGRTCGERITWPCDQIACTILSQCVCQLCIQLRFDRFVDIKYILNLNVIIICLCKAITIVGGCNGWEATWHMFFLINIIIMYDPAKNLACAYISYNIYQYIGYHSYIICVLYIYIYIYIISFDLRPDPNVCNVHYNIMFKEVKIKIRDFCFF